MRYEPTDLNVVQNGTGAGTAFPCRHFVDKWIQVTGIAGGCVLQVQGTIDGTTWVQTGANIVADNVYPVDEGFDQLRINRSVQGTGNPTVKFAGRNERAD